MTNPTTPHDNLFQTLSRRLFLQQALAGSCAVSLLPHVASRVRAAGNAGHGTGLVTHSDYLLHNHYYELADRLKAISNKIATSELADRLTTITPVLSNTTELDSAITNVHASNHLSAIKELPTTGDVSLLAVEGVLEAVTRVANGTLCNAFCAVRPPGHHVTNEMGEEGFCYLGNVAIAAKYLQQELGFERILIIDWDYHHGNGTQYFFYDDPSVLFFSTHDANAYPGRFRNSYPWNNETLSIGSDPTCTGVGEGEGFTINVHLDCGATHETMLAEWDSRLRPKLDSFKPDFVLISAGFDCKANDDLGCFSVTPSGFAELTRQAIAIAEENCSGRIVSVLEGGYANRYSQTFVDLAEAVYAHLEALADHASSISQDLRPATPEVRALATITNGYLLLPPTIAGEYSRMRIMDSQGRTLQDWFPAMDDRRIQLSGRIARRSDLRLVVENRDGSSKTFTIETR